MCFHFAFHTQCYGIICCEFKTVYSLTREASVICVSKWVSSSTHYSLTHGVSKLLMPKHLFSIPPPLTVITLLVCFPRPILLSCFSALLIWKFDPFSYPIYAMGLLFQITHLSYIESSTDYSRLLLVWYFQYQLLLIYNIYNHLLLLNLQTIWFTNSIFSAKGCLSVASFHVTYTPVT